MRQKDLDVLANSIRSLRYIWQTNQPTNQPTIIPLFRLPSRLFPACACEGVNKYLALIAPRSHSTTMNMSAKHRSHQLKEWCIGKPGTRSLEEEAGSERCWTGSIKPDCPKVKFFAPSDLIEPCQYLLFFNYPLPLPSSCMHCDPANCTHLLSVT